MNKITRHKKQNKKVPGFIIKELRWRLPGTKDCFVVNKMLDMGYKVSVAHEESSLIIFFFKNFKRCFIYLKS